MDNTNPHMLEERLAQLPEDVRNAVLSVEWEGKVQAIGQKHRLHIDQVGALGDLTLMTMIGMVNLSDYPSQMAQQLNIPASDAEAITKEVGDEVFMPIRESLKKLSSPTNPAKPAPSTPVALTPVLINTIPSTPTPKVTSATAPVAPAAVNAPITAPIPPKAPVPVSVAPKPDLSAADALLSATTVTTMAAPAAPAAPASAVPMNAEPPKPPAYSTDPYREPPV
jgi:hypothetical protein